MEQTTQETKIEENIKPDAKAIVETLFKERDQYQQATVEQRSDINDIYTAYLGQLSDVKDTSKSQEKIMKLRTEVNYIVPSIFSGQPEIEVEPIGEEDKDFAYVAERIINQDLSVTIPQAYEKIEAWVKQAVVFGTSIIKVLWKFETEENEDGTQTPVTDQPDLEVPNILDCFYNPIIPDVECQNSIIFRSVLPIDEVKENPAYDFTDDKGVLNRTKVESGGTKTTNQYDSSRQYGSDNLVVEKATEGTVEIYERITNDRIQTVCEGKERLVLRDTPWEYDSKCTVKLIHEPNAIPNRFDGFGVGHNTLGLSRMIQKLSNRLQDTVNMGNNPHFLGRKGAGIQKSQLVIRAGGLTEVDGDGALSEQIQPLQVPDIKNGALELLRRFDDEHKRASGANDLLQGAASNRTLGQDQIASTYSSNRFELINRRFKQALADVASVILQLRIKNIQSVNDPILRIFPLQAEITDSGQIQYSRETVYQMLISPEAKDAKFNIKVKGNTNVAKNKDIQIKQLMEAFNVFGQVIPPANQLAWAKKVLELRGIDELDKLIPDPEALQQQVQPQIDPMTGQPMQQPMGAGMGQGLTPQQPNAGL